MSYLLSVITCTGGRRDAFTLCQRWMERQTYSGPIQWIVVDDCVPESDFYSFRFSRRENVTIDKVRPAPLWKPGMNTQARNMLAAIEVVKGDAIAVIEDDDWYHPEYLRMMVSHLRFSGADLVGEGWAKYYHLSARKYLQSQNDFHASLCQTIMDKSALNLLKCAVLSGDPYFDCVLWRLARERRYNTRMIVESRMCVGIKGMPGRGGIGTGHRPDKRYSDDPDLKILEQWIGPDDLELYRPYTERKSIFSVLLDFVHNRVAKAPY